MPIYLTIGKVNGMDPAPPWVSGKTIPMIHTIPRDKYPDILSTTLCLQELITGFNAANSEARQKLSGLSDINERFLKRGAGSFWAVSFLHCW